MFDSDAVIRNGYDESIVKSCAARRDPQLWSLMEQESMIQFVYLVQVNKSKKPFGTTLIPVPAGLQSTEAGFGNILSAKESEQSRGKP